jgi:hypothetical protein
VAVPVGEDLPQAAGDLLLGVAGMDFGQEDVGRGSRKAVKRLVAG